MEKPGVAERLLEAVRDGIDAARFFARHEAVRAMSIDDSALLELASAVEEAASELDEAMMIMLEHEAEESEEFVEPAN